MYSNNNGVGQMIKRLKKFLLVLAVTPFIMMAMLIVTLFLPFLPILAFIWPDSVLVMGK